MENRYECGDGWLPLIKEAQKIIDEWNDGHKDMVKVEFVQVKEKWGELCLYCNLYPEEILEKIMEICKRSHHICENCGTTENVTTEPTHGWVFTLCPSCREKELLRYNKIIKGDD